MYKKKAHIHFIGIGGIGMSGIATILKYQGYTISGCDMELDQHSIKNLQKIGCSIHKGNNTPECADPNINIVVYSSIIQPNNPEIIAAQQRGIATIPRALMLAELMRTKYSVAIAGAHGKTTTTSLISHILIEASIDPTVIIGGHLHSISTNARFGLSDFLVAEADESDRSFLLLHPTLAVITNIDLEHLETYKDLADIKQTFKQFLSQLPFYGKAFVCGDDPHIASLLPIPHISTVKYGIGTHLNQNNYAIDSVVDGNDYTNTNLQENSQSSTALSLKTTHATSIQDIHSAHTSTHNMPKQAQNNDIFADNIVLHNTYSLFDVHTKHQTLGSIRLNMPGKHNILNALGAIALSLDLDIPFGTIATALANFQGVDQRFTHRGSFKGAHLFDDYGHHPKEVELTLEVARKYTKKKICVIFQPHRYTRTYYLWNQFIDTFLNSSIDHLIITDIFPASEQPIEGVTSERLITEIQSQNPSFTCEYMRYETDCHTIENYVKQQAHLYDLILFLGAGKINKVSHSLSKLEAQ